MGAITVIVSVVIGFLLESMSLYPMVFSSYTLNHCKSKDYILNLNSAGIIIGPIC